MHPLKPRHEYHNHIPPSQKQFFGCMHRNLSEMGVQGDSIPSLAEHAVKDFCTFTNPRPCSGADYEELFEVALGT